MNRKILILGGDLRQLTVAKEFKNDGFDVSFYGFDNSTESIPYYIYSDLEKGILENDILIMGIPLSRDNLYLNAPFSKKNIKLSEITEYSDSKKLLFGGILNSSFKSELKAKNILSFDYGLREELSVYNVIPTVEGAISIAINETPFTLHGSNILICGFGRIGKILAKSLSSLGVNVTVSARKLEDLSWIDCYGYKKIKTKNIYDNINRFDIIFNTIPSLVIDEECLKRVKKNSVIIDLASGSGGIDFKYAKLLDIKVIRALSLPGKIAPQTAGIIIKNTISNILTELGVKIWGM